MATEGGLPTESSGQGCVGVRRGRRGQICHLRGSDHHRVAEGSDSIWPHLTAHGGDRRVPSGSDSVPWIRETVFASTALNISHVLPLMVSKPALWDRAARRFWVTIWHFGPGFARCA
jgi:hypothetical protein